MIIVIFKYNYNTFNLFLLATLDQQQNIINIIRHFAEKVF